MQLISKLVFFFFLHVCLQPVKRQTHASLEICNFFHLHKQSYFTLLSIPSSISLVNILHCNKAAMWWQGQMHPLSFDHLCVEWLFSQCWNHITTTKKKKTMFVQHVMPCRNAEPVKTQNDLIRQSFDKAVKVERHDQIFQRRCCKRHRVR